MNTWQVFLLPSAFDGITFLSILHHGSGLIVSGQTQEGTLRTWLLQRAAGGG